MSSYGLDLAGFRSGKSGLAKADWADDRTIDVVLYLDHPFSRKWSQCSSLSDMQESEAAVIHRCCGSGKLMVDVPIDLQELPKVADPCYIWQLTHRPVDQAFGGFPPLAESIGYCVARFANLLRYIHANTGTNPLGTTVFETYPAASLSLLGITEPYKQGRATYRDGRWTAQRSTEKHVGKDCGLANLATRLRIQPSTAIFLDDDELDATICAVTGLLADQHLLQGDELGKMIGERLGAESSSHVLVTAPVGYVLIRSLPEDLLIRVTKRKW